MGYTRKGPKGRVNPPANILPLPLPLPLPNIIILPEWLENALQGVTTIDELHDAINEMRVNGSITADERADMTTFVHELAETSPDVSEEDRVPLGIEVTIGVLVDSRGPASGITHPFPLRHLYYPADFQEGGRRSRRSRKTRKGKGRKGKSRKTRGRR